ncbi:male sterility protein-domain-containing protein [Pterulicium gracile]|uniref:Male sterility protein-domain-containing protein n=1 Tax=Pterulicium gracile TaxID=1884261 RepID=A0A5C3QD19_9AGAR|nr:male sterility protein-domain-containing protein [Pterula gracilis]
MSSEFRQTPYRISTTSVEDILQAISRYGEGLQGVLSPTAEPQSASSPSQFRALLTGSTGNLGMHLLVWLLENPEVTRVYAYNRPSSTNASSFDRHKDQMTAHALDHAHLHSEKLVFLEGSSHSTRLGLQQHEYDELFAQINLVIHNAWRLDFNLPLQVYEPLIAGSRNLIHVSQAAHHRSDLRFVSVSSVLSVFS